MAKIKNPLTFSSVFSIDPTVLQRMGIFDPVLNVDTKLFIDPLLLEKSGFEMIQIQAVREYKKHYLQIISLLDKSSRKDDIAWRSAKNLIQRKEVEGTCLGYGVNSISGRSLSTKLQEKIIETAKEIIDIGIKDPELFTLLPLFEEGIGPDTISDITTASIQKVLYSFTAEIAKVIGVKTISVTYKGEDIEIIQNPLRRRISPIVLLPQDVLRKLPFATSWDDISTVSAFNATLRERVNKYIGKIWTARTQREKRKIRDQILGSKEALNVLIDVVKSGIVKPYDFEKDEYSIVAWRRIIENVAVENPKTISCTSNTEDSLKSVVKEIIDQYKFLIEDRGLSKLLWRVRNEPNHESVSQMLFFSTAYAYCKANDIDINPEMDTGTGVIDFKFSKGFKKRVVVEIKHSYNPNIINGFSIQLALYEKAEETSFGFYIVINVGRLGKKLEKLTRMYNDSEKKADIVYIDGRVKPTASKRK